MHRIGGLEKDKLTPVISSNPENHQYMVDTRRKKIEKIADFIPEQKVVGDKDADTLIVGWGGTYGHLLEAMLRIQTTGRKVAFAHFRHISPLPRNTHDLLKKYKRVIVADQNEGQFAAYLTGRFEDLGNIRRFNRVEGQPFKVSELVEEFTKMMEAK
jgi:2-oxoglutarate ferredoxin oxidoreductase subunit alpha